VVQGLWRAPGRHVGKPEDQVITYHTPRLCSVPGCGKVHAANGLCGKHYYEQRKLEGKIKGVRIPA
jgi:hypothetical protein